MSEALHNFRPNPTQSADTWVVTMSPPNLQDLSRQPGVFDVSSGSDQAALDGTPYAEF